MQRGKPMENGQKWPKIDKMQRGKPMENGENDEKSTKCKGVSPWKMVKMTKNRQNAKG